MLDNNFIRKFRASFDKAQQRSDQRRNYKATLGHPDGRLATPRTNYFYARVQFPDGVGISEVLCIKVAPTYDAQVFVAYNLTDELEVQGFNSTALTYFGDFTPPSTGLHAWTHGLFPAPDTLISDGLQLDILRVMPTNTPSNSVYIRPYLYQDSDSSFALFAGGSINLAAYMPGTLDQQTLVLVGFNAATGNAQVVNGTTAYFAGYSRSQMPFTLSDIAAVSGTPDFVSAAAVRLMYGVTEIQPHDIIAHTHQWYDANVGGFIPLRRGGLNRSVLTDIGYPFFNNGASYTIQCYGGQINPPTVNDDDTLGFGPGGWWITNTSAGANEDAMYTNISAATGSALWKRIDNNIFYSANVSIPPTASELTAAIGSPATVGAGFKAILDDNGAGTTVYLVASNGTSWYHSLMTLAL